jgi:hypothetical protein
MSEKKLVRDLGRPDTQKAIHRHRKNLDAYTARPLLIERCCSCIHPVSHPYEIGLRSSTCEFRAIRNDHHDVFCHTSLDDDDRYGGF